MPADFDIPARPGSYVLLLALDRPLALPAPFAGTTLAPGRYAYAGSARGPGGLRARLARHLRADKRPHWHVDWLTAAARTEAVGISETESECDLAARLLSTAGATIPVPGFGSSDCRRCTAHLIATDKAGALPLRWIIPDRTDMQTPNSTARSRA